MILTAILSGVLIRVVVSAGFAIAGELSNNCWNAENWDWGQIGFSTLGGGAVVDLWMRRKEL